MNKKAMSTLFMVFELAGAVLVIYIMTSIVTDINSDESVVKTRIAKDMVLLTDIMIAAPGNVIAYYPTDTSEYIISIKDKQVMVFKDAKDPPTKRIIQRFIPFKGLLLEGEVNKQKLIHFKKESSSLYAGSGATDLKEKPISESAIVYTKDENWQDKKIIIAPKAIDGDINNIGSAIAANLNQLSKKETAELKSLVDVDHADMTVEFKITEEKQNTITIYIPSNLDFLKQNRKLASKILISLKSKDANKNIKNSNIEIDDSHFVLQESDVAVVVELSKDIKESLGTEITTAIPESIKSYYS